MKNKLKSIIAATTLLVMLPFTITPSSANSRPQEWNGTTSSGAIVADGDIPIVVENELLTIDVATLPYASYDSIDDFLAYDSRLEAKYTFYNPSDMTVTAKLLFPFGEYPEYARLSFGSNGETKLGNDYDKYGVKVNGEDVETKVRYSYCMDDAYIEEYANTISDEYRVDEIFNSETSVTKYTYEINNYADSMINVSLSFFETKNRIFIRGRSAMGTDFVCEEYIYPNSSNTVSFYVIGEPISAEPIIKARSTEDKKETQDYDCKLVNKQTSDFKTFISKYKENKDISDVDWYNLCVESLYSSSERNYTESGVRVIDASIDLKYIFNHTMRWYEYEITLEPGERIVNSVTAPIYPAIEAWDKPIEYHYTYLLSPAVGWADFGRLEIVINTPYEMSETNLEGFEAFDGGYRLVREGLPTDSEGKAKDLTFTLLNDGNTPLHQQSAGDLILNIVLIALIVVLLPIALVAYLIYSAISWVVGLFNK